MPRVTKGSRRPRSDDPEWTLGMDYPDDESSGMFSLDNLVESWTKKQKTTTVVLPEAVEMQLDDDSSMEESTIAPPAPPVVSEACAHVVGDSEETPKKPEGQTKGRRYILGGLLLAIVCIGAIVVVSVFAPNKKTPTATVSSSSNVTVTPSDGPVLSREESFTNIALGLSSQESLDTVESPQRKALDWLINYDAANLTPATQNQREVEERYILAVFYYATGGADWFDSFYFLSQNHVCNWKNLDFGLGVQCQDGNPVVNGFKIGPNNLQGSLPDEIFLLNDMTTFQVIMNPGLTGSIPSTVAKLQNLEILNLNKNYLSGGIPESLLSLPSLTTLWMDENSFEGSIPTMQEGETTLKWWSCNNCGLTGRMPDSLRIPSF